MPEPDLDLLIRAAEGAGDIALTHWKTDHKTWDKGDGAGPVTEADLEVDDFLRNLLMSARPEAGWLSEETEDDQSRLDRDSVFIVDPIDGTRNFAAGEPTWAHSIALVENGQPTAAVIYLPAREKLYAATLDAATRDGQAIGTGARSGIHGAQVLAPRLVSNSDNWHGSAPEMTRHFRPSLAYRMALVAEGRFDAMITLRDAWEWDIAAGALIAQAAGALVSDRFGTAMTFNSPQRLQAGVLLANPALHGDITSRLKV